MDLKDTINKFYYDIAINQLRTMNNLPNCRSITYNSLLYLDNISYKKDCTVSFLADSMNISKSAVTNKINELVKQGLVQKNQSTEDKRIYYLTLTAELEQLYNELEIPFYNTHEEIQKKYSEKEINTFCEILDFIAKNY